MDLSMSKILAAGLIEESSSVIMCHTFMNAQFHCGLIDSAPAPPGGRARCLQEEEVFRKWTRQARVKELKEKGGGEGSTGGGNRENDTPPSLLAAG